MTGFWTDERTEALKAHVAAGLSASQAGAELGCTRNAVISKAHRSKIALRQAPYGRPHDPRTLVRPARTRKPRPAIAHQAPPLAPMEPAPPPLTLDPVEIPVGQRRTLLELTNETCRFPYGEGASLFFCGAPEADAVHGISYCRAHCQIAYQRKAAA